MPEGSGPERPPLTAEDLQRMKEEHDKQWDQRDQEVANVRSRKIQERKRRLREQKKREKL